MARQLKDENLIGSSGSSDMGQVKLITNKQKSDNTVLSVHQTDRRRIMSYDACGC